MYRAEDIQSKEAFAAFHACPSWAYEWAGSSVGFNIGTQAVRRALRSGSIREPNTQALISDIFDCAAPSHFQSHPVWIRLEENWVAHALSRFTFDQLIPLLPSSLCSEMMPLPVAADPLSLFRISPSSPYSSRLPLPLFLTRPHFGTTAKGRLTPPPKGWFLKVGVDSRAARHTWCAVGEAIRRTYRVSPESCIFSANGKAGDFSCRSSGGRLTLGSLL